VQYFAGSFWPVSMKRAVKKSEDARQARPMLLQNIPALSSSINRNQVVLILILLLALALRIYRLDQVPPALFPDEISYVYDAYAILKTGADRTGDPFPVFFRSLQWYSGSWLVIGSIVPSIYFFGLTEFAFRLPSALYGTLGVLFTYFLVRAMQQPREVAWTAAFFLAVSPWHFQISRLATEFVHFPTFLVLALWLFFLFVNSGRILSLCLSAVAFALDIYTYAPARLMTPVMMVVCAVIFYRELVELKWRLVWPALCFMIITLPYIHFVITHSDELTARYRYLAAYNPDFPVSSLKLIVRNYFAHFSWDFLFGRGDDNLRHSTGKTGELYLFDFPLLLLGLAKVIRERSRRSLFLIAWFLLFPVAASLTVEGIPHALRSSLGLPVFQILSAIGLVYLLREGKQWLLFRFAWRGSRRFKSVAKAVVYGSLLPLFAYPIGFHFIDYFTDYPARSIDVWAYGWPDAFAYLRSVEQGYDRIYISGTLPHAEINLLFYTKYDPARYQKHKFNGFKYQYLREDQLVRSFMERNNERALYLIEPKDLPFITTKREIRSSRGTLHMRVVEK
jgi:4-amino-4-deoxy-L-arabinose transferase-like glycosyltransferase